MGKYIIKSNKYWLIIPAAGVGTRMDSNIAKQYLKLKNKLTILDTVLKIFIELDFISGIVVVLNKNDTNFKKSVYHGHKKIVAIVTGGIERHISVYNAIISIKDFAKDDDWILIHDASRPCVSTIDINKLITQTATSDVGGVLVSCINSTIKLVDNNNKTINKTLDRKNIYQSLTPQMFKLKYLLSATENVITNNIKITDDAQAMELYGKQVKVVIGSSNNIKITTKEDINIANALL